MNQSELPTQQRKLEINVDFLAIKYKIYIK